MIIRKIYTSSFYPRCMTNILAFKGYDGKGPRKEDDKKEYLFLCADGMATTYPEKSDRVQKLFQIGESNIVLGTGQLRLYREIVDQLRKSGTEETGEGLAKRIVQLGESLQLIQPLSVETPE